MVRTLKFILVWCLLLSLVRADPEAEIKAKFGTLKKAVEEEREAKKSDSSQTRMVYAGALNSLDYQLEQKDYAGAFEFLKNSLASAFETEKSQTLAKELLVLLQTLVDANREKLKQKIEAVLAEQGKHLLSTENPQDVDPILDSLKAAQAEQMLARSSRYLDYGNSGNYLDSAIRVAADWQDYLNALKKKNYSEVGNRLRNIQEGVTRLPGFIPRSRIGEMLNNLPAEPGSRASSESTTSTFSAEAEALQQARKLLRPIKTGEELQSALDQIMKLKLSNQEQTNHYGLIPVLQRMASSAEAIKRKDPAGAIDLLKRQNQEYPEVALIRRQLISLAIPLFLELTVASPNPEEPNDKYLSRLIDEAAKREDWNMVYRGLYVMRRFNQENYGNILSATQNDDITAVGSILSAQNYFRAEQWVQGGKLLLFALREGKGVDVSTYIGKQLKNLQKEHPAEYSILMGESKRDTSDESSATQAAGSIRLPPDPLPKRKSTTPTPEPDQN